MEALPESKPLFLIWPMSLLSHSGKFLEVFHVLRDQIDMIKVKRTVQIKLSSFPPSTSLGAICEALSDYLRLLSPPIYLERILLSDNALTTLPPEFEFLCGIYLRYLDLHNNNFTTVPAIIGACCPHLEGLDLSLNNLSSLPRSVFANLTDLKVLLLMDNEFSYLPPILGEMINLDAIGVADNPLLMPTLDMVKAMPGGTNDLKAYLLSHSNLLEQLLLLQAQQVQKPPTTPSVARTRSLSDTRSKSQKASRRMGLIINSNKSTPEEASKSQPPQDMITPSKPERKPLFPTSEKSEFLSLLDRKDSSFNLDSTPVTSTYTTTTAGHSRSSSPSSVNLTSRPGSRNRSRSNTLREINAILDNNELTDPDHKSGAYFRRLSTLQERPADETFRSSQEELAASAQIEEPPKRPHATSVTQDSSPLKNTVRKVSISTSALAEPMMYHNNLAETHTTHDLTTVLKVARKVLFSVSEVHSSIKRFTGFCSDRKVTLKIVPLLHTTKGNIDLLVESIEAAEENGDSQEALMNAIHTCITSFKQIFDMVGENFVAFVAKADICFIRMVYLSLYGSFSEMQNAYRLLNPLNVSLKIPPTLTRNQSGLALTTLDQKSKQSLSLAAEELQSNSNDTTTVLEPEQLSTEEIDEKLYQCIDLATTNARIVFSELTKAIGKSAIASANNNGSNGTQPINLTVSNKFKDLTNVCISSMEITNRLTLKLATIRSNQLPPFRRLFWDDINLFLKAIIQTFSSVKAIMKDAPILNDVRQSMATLTKTTKDLTILLEASSYRSKPDSLSISTNHLQASLASAVLPPTGPPSLSSLHSSSAVNLPQLLASVALLRTPLVATVGAAAAQAILPPSDPVHPIIGSVAANAPVSLSIPPLVSSDVLNTGLHTAPVQSMEQYYAKSVNPFDKI